MQSPYPTDQSIKPGKEHWLTTVMARNRSCPCGSAEAYQACCGPFHAGRSTAPTAETLMRSRYSAFVRHEADYLAATWHPSTRPARLQLDPDRVWTHLEVVRVRGGAADDPRGMVEFRAHHTTGVQAERSTFLHEDGRWFYLDSEPL
jgi:SEC-C motif-containing protein